MKCAICNGEIKSNKLYAGDFECINGAVLGDTIEVKGHKTCCQAVDNLVVLPNRLRLAGITEAKASAPIPEIKTAYELMQEKENG